MIPSKNALVVKVLKITGITVAVILTLLIVLPMVFADTITEKVKSLANENLAGELNFTDSKLSFFKEFPSLTLTLKEFDLKGSKPYEETTLVAAKEIGFGINVWSVLFGNQTEIDEIYLTNAILNIQVNKNGAANYNIYKSESTDTPTSSESASLNLEKIQISNSQLTYNDASAKILIEAKGFNYKGKGDLLASNFNLKTTAEIADLTFSFDQKEYLKTKK